MPSLLSGGESPDLHGAPKDSSRKGPDIQATKLTKCIRRQLQIQYCLLRHRLSFVASDFQIQSTRRLVRRRPVDFNVCFVLPFLSMLKPNLTSAMQKNSKNKSRQFVNTKPTFPKNFSRGPRNRSLHDGSTNAWISNPEVIDKYVLYFLCQVGSVNAAPALFTIMQVLIG